MLDVWKTFGVTSKYETSLSTGGPGETRAYHLGTPSKDPLKPRYHSIYRAKCSQNPFRPQIQIRANTAKYEQRDVWNLFGMLSLSARAAPISKINLSDQLISFLTRNLEVSNQNALSGSSIARGSLWNTLKSQLEISLVI